MSNRHTTDLIQAAMCIPGTLQAELRQSAKSQWHFLMSVKIDWGHNADHVLRDVQHALKPYTPAGYVIDVEVMINEP